MRPRPRRIATLKLVQLDQDARRAQPLGLVDAMRLLRVDELRIQIEAQLALKGGERAQERLGELLLRERAAAVSVPAPDLGERERLAHLVPARRIRRPTQ